MLQRFELMGSRRIWLYDFTTVTIIARNKRILSIRCV